MPSTAVPVRFRIRRGVAGELQMKRPQCALLAEASRLLGAVLALTPQGGWLGGGRTSRILGFEG